MHRLSTDPQFAGVTVFALDYDTGREHLRRFNVRQQGTLIAFKGRRETGRSIGETDPDALRQLFEAGR